MTRLLVASALEVWPEHADYLARSFEGRSGDALETSEIIASQVGKLAGHVDGGIPRLCRDYRYLCQEIMLPEELHFRRSGGYRLTTFADACREVYANAPLMEKYMNGLLVSNVFWANHTEAVTTYRLGYLPRLGSGSAHLEVGPGHGLLMLLAAARGEVASLTGWDVSETSIASTRRAFTAMGVSRPITLARMDVFAPGNAALVTHRASFDSIVLSEVLEHLEAPDVALDSLHGLLRPGGLLWVNVPINSPAPDHLYLLRTPQAAADAILARGFEIVAAENFPMSGVSMERAREEELTITCIITARRPH